LPQTFLILRRTEQETKTIMHNTPGVLLVERYLRYVDDILVLYREDKTNIHELLEDFNNLAPTMKFTLEKEQSNRINFLDITITKSQDGLSFEIYRKPTTTNIIIPNDSCHPREHKTAAIRYYCN
jgi:hypothetical protein